MPHDLERLHAELAAAGVAVPALGSVDGVPHTYDASGAIVPLPKAAARVVKAHRPRPTARDADLATVRASSDPVIRALLRLLGLAE